MSLTSKIAAGALAVSALAGAVGALPSAHADTTLPPTGAIAPTDTVADDTATASARSLPPSSVDLRQWAVPVRNQGQVGSCVEYAINYAMMGWYAKRDGLAGSPYAPMYIYSQLVGGQGGPTVGTHPYDALTMSVAQGVDTAADYTQGAWTNYSTLPTAAERVNAAHYKIRGFTRLFASQNGNVSTAATTLKNALAAGHPVAITIQVRHGFDVLGDDPAVDTDTTSAIRGQHEVLALGYNSSGLLIQNSWGSTDSSWPNNSTGFGRLGWTVVNHDVLEADTISGLSVATPSVGDHSLDTDNNNDVIARTSDGNLHLYPGNGAGRFLTSSTMGSGFNDFNIIRVSKDLNGDGQADVLARDIWGSLWLFEGDGVGGFARYINIPGDFSGYDELLAPGDWNGDGKADVIARTTDGYLWLLAGDGRGNLAARVEIGHGWSTLTVVAPGDFDGDLHPDLLARRSDGTLWIYPGNGVGGFKSPWQNGSGWGSLTIIAPGDFNNDSHSDLLVRRPDATLWIYPGNGAGRFLSPWQDGSGWGSFTALN